MWRSALAKAVKGANTAERGAKGEAKAVKAVKGEAKGANTAGKEENTAAKVAKGEAKEAKAAGETFQLPIRPLGEIAKARVKLAGCTFNRPALFLCPRAFGRVVWNLKVNYADGLNLHFYLPKWQSAKSKEKWEGRAVPIARAVRSRR